MSYLVQVGSDDVFRDYDEMIKKDAEIEAEKRLRQTNTDSGAKEHPHADLLQYIKDTQQREVVLAFREYLAATASRPVEECIPVGVQKHECTPSCNWWIRGDLYVCTKSGNFHMCTSSTCPYWTDDDKEGFSICKKTATVREKTRICDQLWDQDGHLHYHVPSGVCLQDGSSAGTVESKGFKDSGGSEAQDRFSTVRYRSQRNPPTAPPLSGQRKRKPVATADKAGDGTLKRKRSGDSRHGEAATKRRKRAVQIESDAVLYQRGMQVLKGFLKKPTKEDNPSYMKHWLRAIFQLWNVIITTPAFQTYGDSYSFAVHCQVVVYHMQTGRRVGEHDIPHDPTVRELLRVNDIVKKPTCRKFTSCEKFFLFALSI